MKKLRNYPLNTVRKFDSLRDMLLIAVAEAGDRNAFMFHKNGATVSVTYSEFLSEVAALATSVASLVKPGSHVAMIGDNSYEWLCVYLASVCGDTVFMPVDRELPADNIMNVLNSGDADIVFYSKRYETLFRERRNELPRVKYFVGIDLTESDGEFLDFASVCEKGRELVRNGDTSFYDRKPDTSELRMLVYTSGTTGTAKGVMLTEHNLISSVYYGLMVSDVYTRSLSVLPYHHTYEAVSGILVSIHKHTTVCINENIKTVMRNLEEFKPDYIYLVPAFVEEFYRRIWSNARKSGKEKGLKKLLKISDSLRGAGIDLRRKLFGAIHDAFGGKLKKIVCGGAPIRPELGDFFDSIGIDLINGYGITECSPLVSANRDRFNDPATVGVVLPCLDVKIDVSAVGDDESDKASGSGEICVKGDVVMAGYYKRPDLTAAVFDDEGYFHTGDIGRFNEYNQLMITGRIKNLIVLRNGKNVYPEEIEELIRAIPYVKETLVTAIEDENGEETGLCAEVFLNADMVKELNIAEPEEQIKTDIAAVCAKLPSYKRPSKIVLRDKEFDKTTSNKIKRKYPARK